MTEKYYTTPAGYKRFKDRLKGEAKRYDKVRASNEDAADAGDNSVWHDNFAYEQTQREMHQQAHRFLMLEDIYQKLVVVDIDPNPEIVKIGCVVVIYDSAEDKEKKYIIAGYEDGDLNQNRISYVTPLAQALMGARIGDVRNFQKGKLHKELEVISIDPLKEDKA